MHIMKHSIKIVCRLGMFKFNPHFTKSLGQAAYHKCDATCQIQAYFALDICHKSMHFFKVILFNKFFMQIDILVLKYSQEYYFLDMKQILA